jgi:riboflavin synthase
MFTGIIEDIGTVDRTAETSAGREFRVHCRDRDLVPGESIALNGVCLTVREAGDGWFVAAAMVTTLSRTTMASWRHGTRVNLERAVRPGDRLGGHLVQGHVDGVGEIRRVERRETALLIDIAAADEIASLVVPHGAIAVDGVSLTVNALLEPFVFQVSIIEYTERHTTLGGLTTGTRVHLESDIIGKYVRQLLEPYRRDSSRR